MGYEDSVYLAKLAEQAERYEGKSMRLTSQFASSLFDSGVQRWWRT